MTKEQFWRIIEDVNAVSQNHDQETVWTRIVENLSHYPLEDIMDWHLIYHEYKDAAYRDEMFAVSTALGSDYADEGLNNFRAWLISCGKEVFMNALREPVTLVDSPKKDGCFNYGKYDYAAFYAYNAKMFRIDPDSTQDLIYALEDYTLDRETIEDIHEELPKQQGFGQNGVGASFANYYSPNCGKNNAPQSDAIQALMDSGEVVHAHVYSNGGREEFLFHNTPENIASFIGSRPFVDQMILTTPMDELIMNTMGNFIDQCPDSIDFRRLKTPEIQRRRVAVHVCEPYNASRLPTGRAAFFLIRLTIRPYRIFAAILCHPTEPLRFKPPHSAALRLQQSCCGRFCVSWRISLPKSTGQSF